jgi:hypothetical protein
MLLADKSPKVNYWRHSISRQGISDPLVCNFCAWRAQKPHTKKICFTAAPELAEGLPKAR